MIKKVGNRWDVTCHCTQAVLPTKACEAGSFLRNICERWTLQVNPTAIITKQHRRNALVFGSHLREKSITFLR